MACVELIPIVKCGVAHQFAISVSGVLFTRMTLARMHARTHVHTHRCTHARTHACMHTDVPPITLKDN